MTDQCPHCEGQRVELAVPETVPGTDADGLVCCGRCLRATDCAPPAGEPAVETIHERLPRGEAGVTLVVLLQQLDSLALNRSTIESLFDRLETDGVDVFLTLDRLIAAAAIEPYFDLSRRRDQLEDLVSE
jgi:hypothetical protein